MNKQMKRIEMRKGEYFIEFTDAEYLYSHCHSIFYKHAENTGNGFEDQIESIYAENVPIKAIAEIGEYAEKEINKIIENKLIPLLIKCNIYEYDFSRIVTEYNVYDCWNEVFFPLWNKYMEIVSDNEEERNYRQMRKDSRGRWIGGGFGVGGAIKGAATASAMNAVTGISHSVVNSLGNMMSNHQMQKRLQGLNTEKNRQRLCNAYKNNIVYFADILADIFEKNGKVIKKYSEIEIGKCKSIINNLNKIQDEKQAIGALLQAIKIYPYEMQAYEIYMRKYYCFGDGFEELCEFAGEDLEILFVKIVSQLFGDIDSTDEEKYIEALKTYKIFKDNCKFKNNRYEEELEPLFVYAEDFKDNILASVYRKLINNPSLATNNILKAIRSDKDFSKIRYNQFFELLRSIKIDELEMSDRPISCKRIDDAIVLWEQRKTIKEIYSKLELGNMESAEWAYNQVQEIYNKYKIGKSVCEYLGAVNMAHKAVFDIGVCDEETDYLQISQTGYAWSERTRLVNAYSEEEMTEVIIYTKNQEQKDKIEGEIEDILKLCKTMDIHKEDEVRYILEKTQSLYKECSLGSKLIQKLEKFLFNIDLEKRTVGDVAYATIEEAEYERKKYVGNVKYNSPEEALAAMRELENIEQIIDSNKNRGILGDIDSLQYLRNQNYVYDSSKERIRKLEIDIAGAYDSLLYTDKEMKKDKVKAKKMAVAAIPVILIGLILFFGGGLIRKIIIVIVLVCYWSELQDVRKKTEEYFHNGQKVLKSVQSIVNIKGNEVCFYVNENRRENAFCIACGNKIKPSAKYCPSCGKAVR